MTRPPARTAVLVGNGVFPQAEGVLTPLAAPEHDVSVLAALLADPEVCRFDAPTTLIDCDAQTIKKTLLRTLNGARPQDLVLVYYAGHGKLDGSQLYLCTRDTEHETLAATAVAISDIREYVNRSPCKQVVLILDCCFSGAAADEFRTRGELSDRIEAVASARGLYLLTSCANYETSVEHAGTGEDNIPYGLYTRALADGILSGEADLYGDGQITPLELARFLQSRIPGQTPRVSLIDGEGEEPVLAWTNWTQNDSERKRVRTRLTQWFAEESIPDEVFYQALGLLGRVPQSVLEKRRKRLLGLSGRAGWEDVFTRGWLALDATGDDPVAQLERFLTEHAADGTLSEYLYTEAMRLLASDSLGELQQRRKRLLTRCALSPERDISVLVEAWRALDPPVVSTGPEPDTAPHAPVWASLIGLVIGVVAALMAPTASDLPDMLVASPLPHLTAAPRQEDTDFPGTAGVLEQVRFYEAAYPPQQPAPTDYGFRFPGTARYIFYELRAVTPDTASQVLEGVWYGPSGSEIHRDTIVAEDGKWMGRGYGSNTAGSFSSGVYYLEILHNRYRIATGSFEIRPDSSTVYDLPGIDGRATDMRFYDNQRTVDQESRPQWRFSSRRKIVLSSWLQFDHSPAASARDYTIEAVYYTSSGQQVQHATGTAQVQIGTTRTTVNLPGTYARDWERGLYIAEFFVNGTRIARGMFDIY